MPPRESPGRRGEPADERSRFGVPVALLLGLACVGGAYAYFGAKDPIEDGASSAAPSSAPVAALPGRCSAAGSDFVVGKLAASAEKPTPPPGIPGIDDKPTEARADDDAFAPFAAVMARAGTTVDGLFVGVLVEGDGGMVSALATLKESGEGALIKLARSRGDLEPPIAVADGANVVAGVLEPDGAGLKVRLARIAKGEVTWGGEVEQKSDESLTFDVAISKGRGVVVWDEIDGAYSIVLARTFALESLGGFTGKKVISRKETDATAPRTFARPGGGFYVTYLARGEAIAEGDEEPPDAGPQPKRRDDREVDETKGGEPIVHTHIIVVPLDENGAPSGEPIGVTDGKGRVVAYDAILRGDDLLFAYRDEVAPSGGEMGAVRLAALKPSGQVEPRDVLEDDIGDGAPVLIDGWLALPSLRGADALARMDAHGKLLEPPETEQSLARGEPVAASGDKVFLAVPDGKALRLRAVRCSDTRPVRAPAPTFSAAPAAGDDL